VKAVVVSHVDAPPALVETAPPTPDAGEVVITMAACGLNFADRLMIAGNYQDQPEFPLTPGMEIAGTVVGLGTGVSSDMLGRRVVAFCRHGGLAERVVAASDMCIPLPDALSDTGAAAVPVTFGTTHLALTHTVSLRAADTLIVTGAAGGVGLAAVETGKLLGARVIAIARGHQKRDIALAAGADVAVDAGSPTLTQELFDLGKARVVFDTVGGPLFPALVSATAPEGHILLIGFASGTLPDIKPNHLLVKNISVHGVNWGAYPSFNRPAFTQSISAALDWAALGRVRAHVSEVLPLAQAPEALGLLGSRAISGKIVVTP